MAVIDLNEVDANFYLPYGRAMGAWAQLEQSLGLIFMRLVELDWARAEAVYYSARSFQGRAEMVQACIQFARIIPAGKIFLSRSVGLASNYAQARNRLAHDPHILKIEEDDAGLNARRFIQPLRRPDPVTPELAERIRLNFANLAALNEFSLGRQKLLREPELSLELLDLLPTDAEATGTDQQVVGARISALLQHDG